LQNFFVPVVSLVFRCRQNKSPFAIALGDWFPFRTYFLTSKASPNDTWIIVIIVIIIVIGEAQLVLHSAGIIAQTSNLRYCVRRKLLKAWEGPLDAAAAQNLVEARCEQVDEAKVESTEK